MRCFRERSKPINIDRRNLMAVTFLLLALSCVPTVHAESAWAQKKLISGKSPIRSACMMPIETSISKLGVKTSETMSAESDAWATALQSLVEAQFRNVGITVTAAGNPLSSGASDAELRDAIQQIQQKFHAVSGVLDKKPRQIGKDAYTLGDQVATLPCAANSDVLVFIRAAGVVPTVGRQTMAFAGGALVQQGAVLNITFADAKNGEILAMLRIRNADDFLTYQKGKFLVADEEKTFGAPLLDGFADINLGSARKLQEKRDFGSP